MNVIAINAVIREIFIDTQSNNDVFNIIGIPIVNLTEILANSSMLILWHFEIVGVYCRLIVYFFKTRDFLRRTFLFLTLCVIFGNISHHARVEMSISCCVNFQGWLQKLCQTQADKKYPFSFGQLTSFCPPLLAT